MLSLDSSRWSQLRHAYGDASDIPDLLRQLESLPESQGDSEPWFSLWSALAHQGDVYSASFAAVPHVVEALAQSPRSASYEYFAFPAWVEICRQNRNVEIPADIERAYFAALARLPFLGAEASRRDWDIATFGSVMGAIAAAKGQHKIAEFLLEVTPDMIDDLMQVVYSR